MNNTGHCSEALFAPLHPQEGEAGRRFVIWHQPRLSTPLGLVVHAHAFAEEMNKSRRMVALQAQALAQCGYAVLLLDLLGCGDSPGDFVQARWQGWLDDLRAACLWGLARCKAQWPGQPEPEPWIWGLRAGCLLASAVAAQRPAGLAWNQVYWQPQLAGKTAITQFLRLKTAAGGLQNGDAKLAGLAMRQDLAQGHAVEVAGYRLAPQLVLAMEQARLHTPDANAHVLWLETSTREPAKLLPASSATLKAWQTTSSHRPKRSAMSSQAVLGPAFWSTAEIEESPALIAATCQLMQAHTLTTSGANKAGATA